MQTKLIRWIVFGTVLASFQLAVAQQPTLNDVSTAKVGKGIQVEITGQNLAQPKVLRAYGKRSYILEFKGWLKTKPSKVNIDHGGLDYVQYGWYRSKPPTVRVHLKLDSPDDPKLERTDTGWLVSLNTTEKAKSPFRSGDNFPSIVPPLKPFKAVTDSAKTDAKPDGTLVAALADADVFGAGNNFPDKVPPISPSKAKAPSMAPAMKTTSSMMGSSYSSNPRVSLDFVNTEVVQILKALALQSGVNIVTAPEVQGSLTVSLNNVTVTEALDFVTTMAGLRYSKVGTTYIVTSAERFTPVLRQINGGVDENSETRVVSLKSGEGLQIKAAVLKAIPQNTTKGSYEIVLPTEDLMISSKGNQAVSALPSEGGEEGGSGSEVQTFAGTSKQSEDEEKDMYLVLIGPKVRLNEVEPLVRELDSKIVVAARLGFASNVETRVVPVYSGQMGKIRETLEGMLKRDPNKDAYQISDSLSVDPGADNMNLLMISGPADSIDNLADFAKTLDRGIAEASSIPVPSTAEEAQRIYEVVDLNFIEPVEAAAEVQQKIRGIRASLLPQPVDPLILTSRDRTLGRTKQPSVGLRKTAFGTVSTSGSGESASTEGTGEEASAAPAQATGKSNESGAGSAATLDKALGSEPMKLLLYGTRGQIGEARSLLAKIDLEPNTVALEMRVMELSREDALKIGLDWSVLTGGTLQTLRVNQGLGGTISNPGNFSTDLRFEGGGTAGILGTLDEIADNGRLIARPNLLTTDGRPSEVFVGDEVRYIESITSSQNGPTITTGTVNVGVGFTVTSRVGGDGTITLDMIPELSILQGFTPVPGGGNLPQTSVRRAQSIATLKDGETIAIGGLIQEQERKTVSGIPILKDIPIIGKLFSRTDKTRTRKEVVFFITAKVANKDKRNAASPRHNEQKNPAEINQK